ncbi:lysozyme [Paucilactobacillus hokkaidonensis JCM 18461]|uniref:Lysozyme n=2 Tax=Paucilactobacillus hokkaidonensis TaxID=1193095 RepID=A0A0A1GWI9_9LACO|nr:GH25 family lysozyme [Paucilactobacillus hokkaidonensis]KRO09577.1 lysozyme [Paucilactobacillus hokkaidonensis]BAP85198.1 lysozyme [Paucilactobacillus hokkaidonensis JCM 18461]
MAKRKIEPIYDNTFRRSNRHNYKKHPWIILVIVLLVLGGAGGLIWHNHHQSALNSYAVRGVSVNQADGYVDFHQLQSQKIKFAYLKATSGASYLDDDFIDNYQRISGSNLQVGIYQQFSFTSSAKSQFRYLVSQVQQQSGNLPIAIQVTYYGKYADTPPNAKKQGQKLAELAELLSEHYGQGCIIWATPAVQRDIVDSYLPQNKKWSVPTKLKRQGKDVMFIQYTGHQKLEVDGVRTDLTQSVFNGSLKQWNEQFGSNE